MIVLNFSLSDLDVHITTNLQAGHSYERVAEESYNRKRSKRHDTTRKLGIFNGVGRASFPARRRAVIGPQRV